MKANFNNNVNISQLSKYRHRSMQKQDFGEHKLDDNTSMKNIARPAQAISFGGSAVSIGTKFVESKAMNSLIGFISDNEAAYNAIYSLLIAGIIKPIVVMKTKDADEKDKQIIATKNFLQAFLGSFLSLTVGGGIVKKAYDIIKNNIDLINIDKNNVITVVDEQSNKALEIAEKILKKEHSGMSAKFTQGKEALKNSKGINKLGAFFKGFLGHINYVPTDSAIKEKASSLVQTCKEHKEIFTKNPNFVKDLKSKVVDAKSGTTINQAYESFWKNSTNWITVIAKAKIASWLLPSVMAVIFTKHNIEKAKNEAEKRNAELSPLLNSQILKTEQEQFNSLLNKKAAPIAFKGKIFDTAAENLSKVVEKISMTNFGEKSVKLLQKTKKPSARMADIESGLLTAYWVQNTARSKKIEPDQKLGLNVQTVLVTIVSSSLAFLIDFALDGLIDKGSKIYGDKVKENIGKLAQKIKNGENISNIKEAVQESCKNLLDNEDIAKRIVKKGIDITNDKQVQDVANKFASTYRSKLSKFKSLTIFTLVVRFLVPVLMVKPAGKIKQKIKEMKKNQEEKIAQKA